MYLLDMLVDVSCDVVDADFKMTALDLQIHSSFIREDVLELFWTLVDIIIESWIIMLSCVWMSDQDHWFLQFGRSFQLFQNEAFLMENILAQEEQDAARSVDSVHHILLSWAAFVLVKPDIESFSQQSLAKESDSESGRTLFVADEAVPSLSSWQNRDYSLLLLQRKPMAKVLNSHLAKAFLPRNSEPLRVFIAENIFVNIIERCQKTIFFSWRDQAET